MNRLQSLFGVALLGLLGVATTANAQAYIGYAFPAGGQQGTTVSVKLGGQRLTGTKGVMVSGEGISGKLVKLYRRMSNQEMQIVREQLRELKRKPKPGEKTLPAQEKEKLIAAIESRMTEYCPRPASNAIADLAFVEVTIAPDAEPGAREIRLVTATGITNPLAFHVGQVPEVARKPMHVSDMQVLGKEYLAQRKRPAEEVEMTVSVPCTVNGQVASGEVNWYRFEAKKGQRLVLSAAARQLIPYIADAVPGWFQPVLAVYDVKGKELAFNDDFRFKPDPTLLFEVPEDGEYRFRVTDAIYRGREDFVYRVTVSEIPLVTSIFPLGGSVGVPAKISMQGWNLDGAKLTPPSSDAGPGVHWITAKKDGVVSNAVPFALDTLPECLDQESGNNDLTASQKVELPIIVNGRIDAQDDWDVFEFEGKRGDKIVAEVTARRLDSPLDSMLKITDATGKIVAFNDDHEDLGSGLNTHHADSYVMCELPADSKYYVHIGDTARNGGDEYAYRLRISPPQPDFELRVAPSRAAFRTKGSAAFTVYPFRKDGFDGDITIKLRKPTEGFIPPKAVLPVSKDFLKGYMRTTLPRTDQPIQLAFEGHATVDGQELVRPAVPAEDMMQAFLWRHLVPAQELPAIVYDPSYVPPPKRVAKPVSAAAKAKIEAAKAEKVPAKFSKRQVTGRLRQLKLLFEEDLLTDDFYHIKVAECDSVL